MTMQGKGSQWFMLMLAVFMAAALISCGSKNKKPTVKMVESSDIYTDAGMKLLNDGQYEDAEREFSWVLRKNPKDPKAAIGRAIARIHQAQNDDALGDLKNGCKHAKISDDKVFCRVAGIRIHSQDKRDKRWFLKTKEAFDAAIKIDPQNSEAYYYMGLACRDNLSFDEAARMFRQVIAIGGRLARDAEEQLFQIQTIQKVMAVTKTGRKIVLVEHITRADCAAIIMEEIKLEKILTGQPQAAEGKSKHPEKTAAAKDIEGQPYRIHIESVLRLGVKGLEKYPDGSFRPEEIVNRATYAVVMEDVLGRLAGNTERRKSFEGTPSPFQDVKPDHASYEAVMTVTTRGIMGMKNPIAALFSPLSSLSGVEALLIAHKLKEDLNID